MNYSAALTNIQTMTDIIEHLLLNKTEKETPKSSAMQQFDYYFEHQQSPAVIKLDDDEVRIHYGEQTLYVVDNDPNSYSKKNWLFVAELPVEFDGNLAIENKYLKINGQTKSVIFRSLTPNILTMKEDGTLYVIKDGNGIIRVSVDNHSADIYLKIIKIPVRRGMKKEALIKKLGLPDKQTKRHIGWAQSEFVDGIFYSPESDQVYGMTVEHWQYERYQGVIFRISELGDLGYLIQKDWNNLSTLKYKLEHK